jgi:hypothetical protein
MTRHGRRQVPPTLDIVDLNRLVGLQQFIGTERIEQVLRQTGRRNRSHCRLTH